MKTTSTHVHSTYTPLLTKISSGTRERRERKNYNVMLEWIGSSSPVSFRETSTCIFCVRIITVMKLEVDRHLAHCMFYFTVSNSLLSKQLRFAFSILIVFSFSFFEQTIFPHVKRCHSSRISDCD